MPSNTLLSIVGETVIRGSEGNDVIIAGSGNDRADGGLGNDVLGRR